MYDHEFMNDDAIISVAVDRIGGCDLIGVWVWRYKDYQSYRLVANDDNQFSWAEHGELEASEPFVVLPGPIFRSLAEALKSGPYSGKLVQATAKAIAEALDWSQIRE